MIHKPRTKNVDDVKLAVATIAVTATFGFWNLFSQQEPQAVDAAIAQVDAAQVVATQTVQTAAPQVVATQPVQQNAIIIFPTQPVTTTFLPSAQPVALPTALPIKKVKASNDSAKQAKQSGKVTRTGSSK
jgi:hypothetical protein